MNRLSRIMPLLLLPAITLAMAPGCESEVQDAGHPAVTSAAAGRVELDTTAYTPRRIDNGQSTFEFVGAKLTGDHTGGFGTWNGTAYFEANELKAVEVIINAGSIFADADRLTGHLRSPDFFDVEQYPDIRFVGHTIEAGGEGGTHTVTGNLTMRGVTRQISFPVTVSQEGDLVRADSAFTINRFDWGIEYPGKPDDLIREQVLVRFNLVSES
ncbi:MAG: YceI family protein [Leptospiraceae bacterium]|nr:YceI family protein [Leptospiraceae bacterium]MCB1315416.1 YceI family protein [Leptospiraceae bacterium]MCB1320379.1 YceI family protein [Leptospiraceae bacterium]